MDSSCLSSSISHLNILENKFWGEIDGIEHHRSTTLVGPNTPVVSIPSEVAHGGRNLIKTVGGGQYMEATGTSVYSKQWLPLWRYVPRLDFHATKLLAKLALCPKPHKKLMNKFVRWINHTLQMCKVKRLDQFRVCFDLSKFAPHDIDKAVEFAFARQVQRLELVGV
ncbi:hypothetical protein RND71_039928 [Anisodus tanguticus]|uniref:Uncharacterized protein n=1 Tax=Anisodus tanguticus TaxID=243964 RepID=A0AAE1R026_9SOLA|nr:hypothetical protein RND71_039928 [Anisodus tanguticus]